MGQDNGDNEAHVGDPREDGPQDRVPPDSTPHDAAPPQDTPQEGQDRPSAPGRDEAPTAAARLLAGRYRLGTVVGRGGMGTVWRARDEVLGRWVAVKELRLPVGIDDSERKRLVTRTMREAKAIATIRSRGVVTIYDVVDEGARPWIVMELIEGRSLAEVVREDGPMRPREAAETGLAILEVLHAAHKAGILHRDVKPSNVIIADEDGRVVLTDFGIAKVEGDPSITSTGMLVGAPSYISPERARGDSLGPAADLWSLGALLYCAVEGRPPYDKGGAIATLTAVMNEPVQTPRSAGILTEVITGLLAKEPDERLDLVRTRVLLREALRTGAAPQETATTALSGSAARRKQTGTPDAAGTAATGPEQHGGSESTPPATPQAAGGTSGPGWFRRQRSLLIAAVAIVLLGLLSAAVANTLTGGGSSTDSSTGGAAGGADDGGDEDGKGDAADREEDGEEDGGADPEDGADPEAEDGSADSGDSDEDTTGPPVTAPENDPDGTFPPESPEGFDRVVNQQFQFSIELPEGWELIRIAGRNSGAVYGAPGGGPPKVQVDFNNAPTDSAESAWRSLEPAVRDGSSEYRVIGIAPVVDWREYPTVADWEFERTEGGERVRVLNRGFRVDSGRGYAIMITCVAAEWDGQECRTLRDTAFATFQPLE
ncbi:protein kinase [Streptomyces sp. ACA25]|uniref:protein kinase domain-containing protein n=1 Tax=Streptomyces sp. ACA25 TaxID=3022596 RepID=UPI002307089B|nr:protein kinase [Streptomyces sp. ACA25]MDB1087401.1 protein kinase [Streptomyces sp. ACA25]